MELGYAVAALIAAGPATYAAWASTLTNRKVKTNHGKNIGVHVEDLVDWAANTTDLMQEHQESDNDIREALGLDRKVLDFTKPGDPNAHDN